MQTCSKCSRTGEQTVFNPSLKTICRECFRAHLRTYYAANKAKYQARDRIHKTPEKRAARKAVEVALRNGAILRQPCLVCGTELVEAHHASYAPEARLDVVWLCRTHHRQAHISPISLGVHSVPRET